MDEQLRCTGVLPGIDHAIMPEPPCSLELQCGRPRMPTKLVFIFSMIRGWFGGSILSAKSCDCLIESQSLAALLDSEGVSLPGATTILENINAISSTTLQATQQALMGYIRNRELDTFELLSIDSTAIRASSEWPTDSKILYKLLARAVATSQRLSAFGLEPMQCCCSERWIEQMRKSDFQIALQGNKAGAKNKRKRHYRDLYLSACKALEKLIARLHSRFDQCNRLDLPHLRKEACLTLLEAISDDLFDASKVMEYSMQRVENDINVRTRDKVLSVADRCASMICKGGREPVLGYKPQLARSRNGFITALQIESGNPADSDALEPMIRESIANTGIVPQDITVDDGYSSAKGLQAAKDLGVERVSISGSKGRRLLGEDLWADPGYQQLRNDRSAVESVIFVVKHNHGFGQLARRGLEEVRCESLEKIIAYNLWRACVVAERKAKPPDKAAA